MSYNPLTEKENSKYDEHGILTVNVYDFLLNPECIEG